MSTSPRAILRSKDNVGADAAQPASARSAGQRPRSREPTSRDVINELLSDFETQANIQAQRPAGEEDTFFTAPGFGATLGANFDDDAFLEQLQEAAEIAMQGGDPRRAPGVAPLTSPSCAPRQSKNGNTRRSMQQATHESCLGGAAAESTAALQHSKDVPRLPSSSQRCTPSAQQLPGNTSAAGGGVFLDRLYAAYAEALRSGDAEAAKAVADAISAEGGVLPGLGHRSPRVMTRSTLASSRPARDEDKAPPLVHRSPLMQRQPDTTARGVCSSPRARPRHRGQARSQPPTTQRSKREQVIAAQLASTQQIPTLDDPVAQEADSGRRHCPAKLGEIHSLPCAEGGPGCLSKAEEASSLRRQCGGIAGVERLRIQTHRTALESSREELPASDAPSPCAAMLSRWAWGHMGGYRCLLEVASLLAAPSVPLTCRSPGCASWHTVALLCGLGGGEELFAPEGVRMEVFVQQPATCLRRAFSTVCEEAGIYGVVSLEELHLALRSLELGARNTDSGDARLRTLAWRELLRAHIDGPSQASGAEVTGSVGWDEGPVQALEEMLEMGTAGIERQARGQSLEELRTLPLGWEACRNMLSNMVRGLRKNVEEAEIYGPYAILGVEIDASDAEIKRAYRDMCLQYHPDKGGDTAMFQSLQQAHEQITEARKKGIRPSKPHHAGAHASPAASSRKSPRQRPSCSPAAARSPRDHSTATGSAGGAWKESDRESQGRAAEALQDIENLHQQAANGAEHARVACQSARAALEVMDDLAATGGTSATELKLSLRPP